MVQDGTPKPFAVHTKRCRRRDLAYTVMTVLQTGYKENPSCWDPTHRAHRYPGTGRDELVAGLMVDALAQAEDSGSRCRATSSSDALATPTALSWQSAATSGLTASAAFHHPFAAWPDPSPLPSATGWHRAPPASCGWRHPAAVLVVTSAESRIASSYHAWSRRTPYRDQLRLRGPASSWLAAVGRPTSPGSVDCWSVPGHAILSTTGTPPLVVDPSGSDNKAKVRPGP